MEQTDTTDGRARHIMRRLGRLHDTLWLYAVTIEAAALAASHRRAYMYC